MVVREFSLHAGLKGEILVYGLEKGFYLFHIFGVQKEGQGSQPAMSSERIGGGGGALATRIPIIRGCYFLGFCMDLVAIVAYEILE